GSGAGTRPDPDTARRRDRSSHKYRITIYYALRTLTGPVRSSWHQDSTSESTGTGGTGAVRWSGSDRGTARPHGGDSPSYCPYRSRTLTISGSPALTAAR